MKKLLAVVLVVIIVLAVLPFVGNKLIESELKKNIDFLTSNGVELSHEQTKSSYLTTDKYYEFRIKDANIFFEYLTSFSNYQLTPKMKDMLQGTKLATQIEYYNIPVDGNVAIDIYPVALSTKVMNKLKNADAKFATYLEEFLQKGGFKYHMNINAYNKEFSGYLKDIDETYKNKKDSKVNLKILGAKYSGKGNILMPDFIKSSVSKLSVDVKENSEVLNVLFENISTYSKFKSRTIYDTSMNFERFYLKTDNMRYDLDFNLKNAMFDISSDFKGVKSNLSLKTKFDKVDMLSGKESLSVSDFVYNMNIKNIDKDGYKKLMDSLSKAKADDSAKMQLQIKKDIQKILSRGIEIEIPDLSVKSILLNGKKDLKGFSSRLNFVLPPNVLTPHVRNPMSVINDIKLDLFLKISKEFFIKLSNISPMVVVTKGFAKEVADDLVYDMKIDHGSVSINGKVVK